MNQMGGVYIAIFPTVLPMLSMALNSVGNSVDN